MVLASPALLWSGRQGKVPPVCDRDIKGTTAGLCCPRGNEWYPEIPDPPRWSFHWSTPLCPYLVRLWHATAICSEAKWQRFEIQVLLIQFCLTFVAPLPFLFLFLPHFLLTFLPLPFYLLFLCLLSSPLFFLLFSPLPSPSLPSPSLPSPSLLSLSHFTQFQSVGPSSIRDIRQTSFNAANCNSGMSWGLRTGINSYQHCNIAILPQQIHYIMILRSSLSV